MAALFLHLPSPFFIQTPSSSSSIPFAPSSLPPLRPARARPNLRFRRRPGPLFSVGQDETELRVSADEEESQQQQQQQQQQQEGEEENKEVPASPEDLKYVEQIKRVLELLRKNRDMTFGEVKLTIMIEDPRDIERKRLLGIEDPDEVTRDDLAAALEDWNVKDIQAESLQVFGDILGGVLPLSTNVGVSVERHLTLRYSGRSASIEHKCWCFGGKVHEGLIPANRIALRLLAEEMIQWPDLEVEAPKTKPRKSLYARATDTGIDPREAAKRLNIDWDSAADIEEEDDNDEIEVPPVVGYSALYLVSALPVIIGISVVLILFYNSLQ